MRMLDAMSYSQPNSNLPPGCTNKDIEDAAGENRCPECDARLAPDGRCHLCQDFDDQDD